jgi:hypothetical protein
MNFVAYFITMDHIRREQQRISKGIAGIYGNVDNHEDALSKAEDNEIRNGEEEVGRIQKGKPKEPIGTIKTFGGRDYIQTAQGWKYHGKGGGKATQKHISQAVGNGHKINVTAGAQGTAPKKGSTTNENEPPVEDKAHYTPVKADVESESDKIAKEKMGDINFRFKMFSQAVKGVISGKFKAAIGYGTGGVGKTYTVTHQLDAAGKKPFDEENDIPGDDSYDYVKITGKMTAPQVYKTLFQHNGKIILFDDCDSVLTDSSSINLFKGALDTSGDGTIQYATTTGVKAENAEGEMEKLPNRFKFNGRAIFVSNLPPHLLPQPLKSRAVRVDLTMDKKQTMDRIKQIATNLKTGKYENLRFPGIDKYSHKDMEDVINYLDKNKEHTADLNVRTVGSILGLKQLAEEDGDGENWEKYADQMLFSKGEVNDFNYDGGLHKSRSQFIDQLYKSHRTFSIAKSEMVKSEHDIDDKFESEQVEKGEIDELQQSFNELLK